ncbi:MAG: phage terminase large subunit [Dehalococcoidia bacterium]
MLKDFVLQAWHVVEPNTPFVDGWHLDAICEHLEAAARGEIRNLCINIPPRFMKSLLVGVFFPCWVWTTQPWKRFLYSSYGQSLAMRDSLKCRRLLASDWYQDRWGDVFQLTGDQNAKIRFDNDQTGYRIATSVGGIGTGEGGDYIITDDPNNALEAESELVRESTNEWWDGTMSTRGNDPKTVVRIIVQQRLHEEDLTGHVLEQGGYDHLCLPMEYEGERSRLSTGWVDPRTEPGELLWPERFGPAEVAELKVRLGAMKTAGQLQQRPAPAEGALFKRAWWRFWVPKDQADLPPVTFRLPNGVMFECQTAVLPDSFDRLVQSWDMAFKDTEESDFVVGQVWGQKGADRFCLDQDRGHYDFPNTLVAVRRMTNRWPRVVRKLIEDKANGTAVISTLTSVVGGIIPVNPEGGKEARANAAAGYVEAGNVYLPHPFLASWVDEFLEEASAFPAGKYDDQVDAMTQAMIYLPMAPPVDRTKMRAYTVNAGPVEQLGGRGRQEPVRRPLPERLIAARDQQIRKAPASARERLAAKYGEAMNPAPDPGRAIWDRLSRF